jgi:3-oxoadipate enol-lactonase
MKFILDNGFLVYERGGIGTPILFIHGFPLSRKIWNAQQEGLSDIADIISVDLRGFGDSFPFQAPYSMELFAEDCTRLLESEKISSPLIICGLSMGGYITLALYRNYPQLFKAMILTSTRSGADSDQGKVNREKTIINVREHGVGNIVDDMLPKLVSNTTLSTRPSLLNTLRSIMLETSVQGVIGSSEGMKNRTDSTSLLSQIKFPVLIIHGADDQLIPISEAEDMHRQIANSHLEIIPAAGHLLNMEQPDLYNQIIRDFIISLG